MVIPTYLRNKMVNMKYLIFGAKKQETAQNFKLR